VCSIYRESGGKKSRKSAAVESRPIARPGLATAGTGHYVAEVPGEPGIEPRMNQSLLRMLGFVVLAGIVLATGFGAIGAPLAVPGGF
jgi:hypothetical protein